MYESRGRVRFLTDYRFCLLAGKKMQTGAYVAFSVFLKLIVLLYVCYFAFRYRLADYCYILWPLLLVFLIVMFPLLFPRLTNAVRLRVQLQKRPPAHMLFLYDRISIERPDSTEEIFYSEIVEIVRIKDSFFLFMTDTRAVLIESSNLCSGDPEGLAPFLSEKCALPVRSFPNVLAYRKE